MSEHKLGDWEFSEEVLAMARRCGEQDAARERPISANPYAAKELRAQYVAGYLRWTVIGQMELPL